MKFLAAARLTCLLFFAWPTPSNALQDDYEYLVVESGETFYIYGEVRRSILIHVKSGGKIALKTGGDEPLLQLVAPGVVIEGTIDANVASAWDKGWGATGDNTRGAGGSGHGGRGGDGYNHADSGGPSYQSQYLPTAGSSGVQSLVGLGGGAVRIDALSLTITSNARIYANGYPFYPASGGGASGGSVSLNGIHTFINSASLEAKGGPGYRPGSSSTTTSTTTATLTSTMTYTTTYTSTPTLTPTPLPAGGGGGGRIMIYRYASYAASSLSMSVAGGSGGGSGAQSGAAGVVEQFTPAPTPLPAELKSPENGSLVGLAPTFNFTAADPQISQFLQYQLQIATDAGFGSLVHTADQRYPDAGWGGRLYYRSNDIATYNLPEGILNLSTSYSWRVRATNDGARWGDWSAIRQFRTIDNPNHRPVKPRLLWPASGQLHVSKVPAFEVLSADPDGNSLTFSVLLSQNPDLLNPTTFLASYPGWDQHRYGSSGAYAGITATCQVQNTVSYPDELQPGITYFWRAVAYDEYQETSQSDIGSFVVVSRPTAPLLTLPSDLAVVTTKQPVLSMVSESPTGSSLRYQLELTSDNFETIITFLSMTSAGWTQPAYASAETASLQIPAAYTLVAGKTYAWRARSYDTANDNWSPMSSTSSFQVITPPLIPALLSPDNGYEAASPEVQLRFSAASESGNTLAYRCELSANQFETIFAAFDQTQAPGPWGASDFASATTAELLLPSSLGLERGVTYWWRVQATDGVSWGPFSETRRFSIANQLAIRRAKIYPNPAVSRGSVRLELELSVASDVGVRIFNASGRQVREYYFSCAGGAPAGLDLPLAGLACGTYIGLIEVQSVYGNRKSTLRFVVVD